MTRDTYLRQAERRFGKSNPQRMDCDHWVEMVRSGETAYAAACRVLGDDKASVHTPEPRWCFDRFGMSRTRLPDGRIICVAGEHEDSYDPDFCIYNDVIVVEPTGSIAIYGYPPEVFPPTDFHSATRVDDRIVLVGSLGYAGKRRCGETQVLSLDLNTFEIEALATGGEGPGWIHRHWARLDAAGRAIWVRGGKVVKLQGDREVPEENERAYRLALRTSRWTAHHASEAEPPPVHLRLPPDWKPLRGDEAQHYADAIARSVAPDHPLFTRDYVALATSFSVTLLRSEEDPERFIVVDGPDFIGRSETPPKFEIFHSLGELLAAAQVGASHWWANGLL